MATILQFQSEQTSQDAPSSTSLEDATTAQIIIFPGVRIERHEDDSLDDVASAEMKTVRQD